MDAQINRQRQGPKSIPIVAIIYRPTSDGEKRLLEALTLLLKEIEGKHISSEVAGKEIRGETRKAENDC